MSSSRAAPVLSVSGELVALGPVESVHARLHARWLNDFWTLRTLGTPPVPRTRESFDLLYQQTIVERASDFVFFTVYERNSLQPIGYSTLQDIDDQLGTAELTLAIGEPDFRGRGFGTETVRLTLAYGFNQRGLHNIILRYYAFNEAGRRAYERAGFHEFARIRDGFAMNGQRWDIVLMDAVADASRSRGADESGRWPLTELG